MSPKSAAARRAVLTTHQGVNGYGSLTQDAVDVLNGKEITERSPSRVPAFSWFDEKLDATVIGSVLVENGQRHLELATDGGTLEMLRERVSVLENVEFETVFP